MGSLDRDAKNILGIEKIPCEWREAKTQGLHPDESECPHGTWGHGPPSRKMPEQKNLLMVRDPRTHVLSLYLSCFHSSETSGGLRGKGADAPDMQTWIRQTAQVV